jgi:hypothetical protein
MAIVHKRGIIQLTGEEAKNFNDRMKNPDPEVTKKRNAYFKAIEENVNVVHKEKGRVVVQFKKKGEW